MRTPEILRKRSEVFCGSDGCNIPSNAINDKRTGACQPLFVYKQKAANRLTVCDGEFATLGTGAQALKIKGGGDDPEPLRRGVRELLRKQINMLRLKPMAVPERWALDAA